MSSDWKLKMKEVKEYIDEHICAVCYLAEIAREFEIHPNDLSNWFHFYQGIGPKEYITITFIQQGNQYINDENFQTKVTFFINPRYVSFIIFKQLFSICS